MTVFTHPYLMSSIYPYISTCLKHIPCVRTRMLTHALENPQLHAHTAQHSSPHAMGDCKSNCFRCFAYYYLLANLYQNLHR